MLAITVTPMTIFFYLMCGAGVFGLIWANKQFKAKGAIWARPLSVIFAIMTLIFAGLATWKNLNPGVDKDVIDEFRRKEIAYQTVATKRLGELIAKNHPSGKALVIKAKYGMGGDTDYLGKAVIEGLKTGLAGNVELIAEERVFDGNLPETDIGPDGMPTGPEEELYSAKIMNDIIKTNKGCNVIISLCGLPNDLQDMDIWRIKDKAKRPAVYLYNGNIYELKLLIKHGLISGGVVDKPVAFDIRAEMPEDEQAAFDKRFLLITSENVDAIAAEYPLFAKEKKK